MIDQYKSKSLRASGRGLNVNKKKNVRFMTVKKIVLLTFLGLLFIFLLCVYLIMNTDVFRQRSSAPDNNVAQHVAGGNAAGSEQSPVLVDMSDDWDPDVYTFLILGRDEGLQTDTMMLALFNVRENEISILNIPRDTYVTSRQFSGKITNVLARGHSNAIRNGTPRGEAAMKEALDFLKGMVQYTFGIPVQYHILIDLRGFRFLVDEIGGVEMYVPQDMYYSDPAQGLLINLRQGVRNLNGAEAEQLVRYRSGYATQDIGRIETQQVFISALMKKLLRFELRTITALFDTASNYMTTNISRTEAVISFAPNILNVSLENVRMHTVPGRWIYPRQVIHRQETIEIIQKYYNPFRRNIPESNFNIYDEEARGVSNMDINIDGVSMAELLR
jgi:LCP family protein required for cell wall assembly